MSFDLVFYWKLFWRRLPVMLVFILVCSTLGVITAMKLPETWSSSARMLVEAPQIPANMVASTVQIGAVEQLDIIQQKLMTRANLIDIADKFDVFENFSAMGPDNVVQAMNAATRIRRTAGSNQATLLTVQFEARSGQIAAAVVNEYVTLILQENADIRVTRAENTLTFFEQEVARLDQELSQQSTAIAQFRAQNQDALPGDQSFRQGRQSLLQERLSRLERDLAASLKQREDIERIFANTGSIRQGRQERQRSPSEEQLIAAQGELERALSIYSDTHPLVVQLIARIERMEKAVAEQLEPVTTQTGDVTTSSSVEDTIFQATMSEINSRIEVLSADVEDTQIELTNLQNALARSDGVAIELATLNREHANIEARYTAAINNLNSARMSERIETTAQGQRISVIESGNIPRTPSGPNRPRIAIIGAAVGMMLAVGYFMLLEMLNRTVRRPAELTNRFNIIPMAIIPYMESSRDRMLRRSGILAATGLVLVGVPLFLWYIDTNYLPLEVVVQRGLAQLGLG